MLFYCGIWSLLCGAFIYFLILNQADFAVTGTRTVFIFNFPLYILIILIGVLIEHGGLRIIGIKKEGRKFFVLNENIKGGHISPDISTEALKEVFYFLSHRPMDGAKIGFRSSSLAIFFTIITEYIASGGMTTNLFIIFISGASGILLLSVFLIYFADHFISPALKESRMLLSKRGKRVKEFRSRLNGLKTKLGFSLTIPIFIVLVIFFILKLDLRIIVFVLVSLVMVVFISRVLSFSIFQTFSEIKDFTDELPKKKKVLFSTGSFNPEVIDLSVDLNRAAEKVYASRAETERFKTELKKKIGELEKWKKLIGGRELKIAELKKERQELEVRVKKKR